MKNHEGREAADRIISLLTTGKSGSVKLPNQDVLAIIAGAKKIFYGEPNIIKLRAPINICGDVHGQFPDFIQIFNNSEYPPTSKYLFLGDYVDRGTQSLEVICLLYALKIKYPNHVYLIRGNHETKELTEQYGFAVECSSKQNKATYNEFITSFDAMPLAATINDKFFCIHGGLTPDLKTIDQIAAIKRPTPIEEHGFLADLVWSDPNPEVDEWAPSERGMTVYWGWQPAVDFMKANNFTKIIRAHQMCEGIDYPFEPDRSVMTVFSAPWYAGEYKNKGAYISVDKNLDVTINPIVHNEKAPEMRFAPPPPDKSGKGGKDKYGKGGKGKGKDKRGRR